MQVFEVIVALLLGGEVSADQDAAFASWHKALRLPTVKGLVVGRSLLYPPDDDVAADRYLAAVRNPTVHVLAHPRCRMFNRRLGLPADWARVFAEAASLDKAVEIDANPNRQDLDVSLLELARDAGVRISIGTDADRFSYPVAVMRIMSARRMPMCSSGICIAGSIVTAA